MVVEIYLAMSAVLMRIDSVKSIEKAINISHKLPGEKGLKLEVQRVKEEIATSSVSHPQSLQVDQQRSSKCSVPPPPIVQELLIISLRPLTVSARKWRVRFGSMLFFDMFRPVRLELVGCGGMRSFGRELVISIPMGFLRIGQSTSAPDSIIKRLRNAMFSIRLLNGGLKSVPILV